MLSRGWAWQEEDEHGWREAKSSHSPRPPERPARTSAQGPRLREAQFVVLCPNQKPRLLLASRALGSMMNRQCSLIRDPGSAAVSTPPLFKTKSARHGQFFQHNFRRAQPGLPGSQDPTSQPNMGTWPSKTEAEVAILRHTTGHTPVSRRGPPTPTLSKDGTSPTRLSTFSQPHPRQLSWSRVL